MTLVGLLGLGAMVFGMATIQDQKEGRLQELPRWIPWAMLVTGLSIELVWLYVLLGMLPN